MNASAPSAPTTGEFTEIQAWFAGAIPDGWFTATPEVRGDRDEVLVVGDLAAPTLPADADDSAHAAAATARIDRFRAETREQRIRIAREAEQRFDRKVSWGASVGERRQLFTTTALPVMTRLRLHDRRTLDTLIDAGVARSRAEALAWCVRLVGQHQQEWIGSLRQALEQVEQVREQGPSVSS